MARANCTILLSRSCHSGSCAPIIGGRKTAALSSSNTSLTGVGLILSSACSALVVIDRSVRLMPKVGHLGNQASKNLIGKLLQMPPSLNQFGCRSGSASPVTPVAAVLATPEGGTAGAANFAGCC